MAGRYDDLVPQSTRNTAGRYDDLIPDATGPEMVVDAGVSGLRGFNRSLFAVPELAYRGTSALANLVGYKMTPYEQTLLGEAGAHFTRGAPTTTAGRFAESVGEAVGAAAIPYAAAPSIAARAAVAPATSVAGRVVQDVAGNIMRAPGASAAIDAAGAAGSGIAMRAAEDAGLGPLGTTVAGIAGGLAPGALVARHLALPPGRAGTETGETIARRRAEETARDIAAFEESGVRPFGPAFHGEAGAGVARNIADLPLVGAPLRNSLDESYAGMAAARDRLATSLSPSATPESAGAAARRGLERFARDDLARLPAAEVEAMGIPAARPVAPETIMPAGARRTIEEAAPIRAEIGADRTTTTRGVPTAPARPMTETLTARTTAGDLDDAQLARLVRTPATETSVATRAEALYERAWRMVPELRRVNGTANPNLVSPINTRNALNAVDRALASAIGGQNTVRGELFDRLTNPRANITLADLRAVRTEIGRALGNTNPLTQTLDKSQLRHIYGAISRDIEVALETLASRAAIRTTRGNAADFVPPQTARAAAGALRAHRVADRYFRMSVERLDRVAQVLNASSPEAAARRLVQAATEGDKGNIRLFRTAMAGLRPEERGEFGSMIVRSLGEPTPSARAMPQEHGFSAQSFVTRYQKMSEEARNLVFTPEHRRALDNLFRVANRIANVEATANSSRSGTAMMNVAGIASIGGGIWTGNIGYPLAMAGSNWALAQLMASPRYTNWLARYIQLRAAVRDGTDRSVAPMIRHLRSFESSARGNPELWPVYLELLQDLKGDR